MSNNGRKDVLKIISDFIDNYLSTAGLRISITFDKKGIRIVHNIGGQFFISKDTPMNVSEIENSICVYLLKVIEDEGIIINELKQKLEKILEGIQANGGRGKSGLEMEDE